MYVRGLKEFLDGLDVSPGLSRRVDCPGCGGGNSFSVTNDHGTLLFNCYKASCTLHGATDGQFTIEDIQKVLARREEYVPPFSTPSHFVPSLPYKGVETRKDVRENRQVFLVLNKEGRTVDAIGKALTPGVKPKWKRYGRSETPFVAGPYGGIGVIVEDCYSAASVGATGLYSGIAILGTNIADGFMAWAKHFKALIVALDYDASSKGAEYVKKLSWFKPCTNVILKRDLKHYQSEEIIEQLKDAREVLDN